jgi:hypothetical protein
MANPYLKSGEHLENTPGQFMGYFRLRAELRPENAAAVQMH